MSHEWLTVDELATRFGKDRKTILRWHEQGMPLRKRDGRLEGAWLKCLQWRENSIRDDARGLRHAGGDVGMRLQLAGAKVRTALAEAEQAEFNVTRARGESVLVSFMAAEFERIGTGIRKKLLALPGAWAGRLGTCTTFVDRRLALLGAVNELLPELRALVGADVAPITDVEAVSVESRA